MKPLVQYLNLAYVTARQGLLRLVKDTFHIFNLALACTERAFHRPESLDDVLQLINMAKLLYAEFHDLPAEMILPNQIHLFEALESLSGGNTTHTEFSCDPHFADHRLGRILAREYSFLQEVNESVHQGFSSKGKKGILRFSHGSLPFRNWDEPRSSSDSEYVYACIPIDRLIVKLEFASCF